MTYVARVEGRNWYRYRDFALDLEPVAYSVEAEGGADAQRSNWIGKSSLLGLVPFVLCGWHAAQEEPEHAVGYEDRWIRGRPGIDPEVAADGGGVVLLSDGTRVERTKRRGQSAQLRVWLPGAESPAAGDSAQALVDRAVGFGRRDFLTAVYARQKRCAQLVTERPSERMRLVAEWLDLERVERAAKSTRGRLSAAVEARDAARSRLADRRAQVARLLDREYGGAPLGGRDPGVVAAELEAARDAASAELTRQQEGREARARWDAARDAEARRERDLAAFAEAERALAALPAPRAPVDVSGARAASVAARSRRESAAQVARGEFGGECPVSPGFSCPARGEINAGGERARAELRAASEEAERAAAEYERQRTLCACVEAERAERQRAEAELGALRQVVAAAPGAGNRFPAPAPPTDPETERAARERLRAVTEAVALLRRDAADLARLRSEVEALEGQIPAMEQRVAELRAAALVLGRGGAQRGVAEVAVAQIARGANAALDECGVDLSVRMRWRDEGADLASSCEACGAAFPRSARARACERCGAERGRVAHDRLTVLLSDRSGGAEDVAGLFLQCAAFDWLAARRSSPWRTMLFDEPFAHMDAANVRAVAGHFARMSRSGGRQLLVVAHQPGILEALPGKILVCDEGDHSTVRVA